MVKRRRPSDEWFTIWNRIIILEGALSRKELSTQSGASIQTILKLQKDWMSGTDITWDGDQFSLKKKVLSFQEDGR